MGCGCRGGTSTVQRSTGQRARATGPTPPPAGPTEYYVVRCPGFPPMSFLAPEDANNHAAAFGCGHVEVTDRAPLT